MKPGPSSARDADARFRLRHGLMWLLYVAMVALNLKMLLHVRGTSGLTLLPALVLSWLSVFAAASSFEAWLDGANRSTAFRVALALSAALSAVMAGWMLRHHVALLAVGLVTLFQRPFELISLTIIGERLLTMLLTLLTFAAFAVLSLRVVWVLFSGDPAVDLALVLAKRRRASVPARSFDGVDAVAVPPPAEPEFVPSARRSGVFPFGGDGRTRLAPDPPARPGRQRYLHRPPELTARSDFHGPVLQGLAFRHGHAPDRRARCEAIGWAALEWVLRAEPSMREVIMALEALPHLAATIDDDDAAEARDWISRLADHPGEFERPLHSMEIIDHVTTETTRVADVATRVLFEWDAERARVAPQGAHAREVDAEAAAPSEQEPRA